MKLLNCTFCHDILRVGETRDPCSCGKASSKYLKDGKSVEVFGHGRILEIDESQYRESLHMHKQYLMLSIVPESSPQIQRKRQKKFISS